MSSQRIIANRCRVAVIISLLAMLPLFAGCSKKVVVNSPVLAKVGSREITTADFEQEVQWRIKTQRSLPDKQALLQEMILHELNLQKAKVAGLENDAEVRRTYEDVLVARVKETQLTSRLEAVKVSADEIRAAYDRDIAKYTRPAKAKLALIYIKANSKLSAEKIAELEGRMHEAQKQAHTLATATPGFGRIAVDFSDDQPSRYQGGDVGWYDEGLVEYRWPKEVVAAGFALKAKGEISDVIKTADGFYLVMKLDLRDQVITPLEQAQASIERRLLSEKRRQLEETFVREMRAFAPVQTDSDALAKVQYPTTTVAKAGESLPPALARP
ncbi:peptidylprolyl isomerase [Pedosphaera parvula]|nr:peptidylprolyl isomerase [Pedosphaera parvula]